MLNKIIISEFKQFEKRVEIPLGNAFAFIGPNNSGKTSALQALALWHAGLQKWREKRGSDNGNGGRGASRGITIHRKDLVFIPIHHSNALWRGKKVRDGNTPIRIEITVCGATNGNEWQCGLEFEYHAEDTFYCRPLRADAAGNDRMAIPPQACKINIAYIPPMSGLTDTEAHIQPGRINVLLGQGKTAEVLRNICYILSEQSDKGAGWGALTETLRKFFGVELQKPVFNQAKGDITLAYSEKGVKYEIQSAGRGTHQVILLLAFLLSKPENGIYTETVFLLDEPDAHLEILKQDTFYETVKEISDGSNAQILMASHSEAILAQTAGTQSAVAFIGRRPHIVGGGEKEEIRKSLTAIGWDEYAKAEMQKWTLFLEGVTDKNILSAFADVLRHPARAALEGGCHIRYIGGDTMVYEYGVFTALKAAVPKLLGLAITDNEQRRPPRGMRAISWKRREIENYIFSYETLMNYADALDKGDDAGSPGDLVAGALPLDYRHKKNMETLIAEEEKALKVQEKPRLFSKERKISDDMERLLKKFARKHSLSLAHKRDFYRLVKYAPDVDKEIVKALDEIASIADKAQKGGA